MFLVCIFCAANLYAMKGEIEFDSGWYYLTYKVNKESDFDFIKPALENFAYQFRLRLEINKVIKSIPENFFSKEFENLQHLDLSWNALSSLPSSIAELSNLRFLDVSHNQLTSIPFSFTRLHRLSQFDFSYNRIYPIPEFLRRSSSSKLQLRLVSYE